MSFLKIIETIKGFISNQWNKVTMFFDKTKKGSINKTTDNNCGINVVDCKIKKVTVIKDKNEN